MRPYIGITGFMSDVEVYTVLSNVPRVPMRAARQIMVGVLASSKTLQRAVNKWPNRYPAMEWIKELFVDKKNTLNLVHYTTKNEGNLVSELGQIIELAGPNFDGFQLNMTWPNPGNLYLFREQFGSWPTIVLQIGHTAFEKIDHNPVELAFQVKNGYSGLVDYVLLDPSGGTGKPLDPEEMLDYLRALASVDAGVGLGVAGGLSADTLYLVEPIVREFPNISIDAEGKLRTESDHLDIHEAIRYRTAASKMFADANALPDLE